MIKELVFVLNVLSAVSAFTAAGLWFWSTRVSVGYRGSRTADGWELSGLTVDYGDGKEVDPFVTGLAQARWNRWAALAAGGAALAQGLATLLNQ